MENSIRFWGLVILVVLLSVIALIYKLLRWISIDHPGLVAKILYLFGFQSPSIESKRWTFFPHDPSKRSDAIIVSFAGGALKVGGTPITEFQRSLSNFQCDQLFVMDPTGMTWYLQDPDSRWEGYKYYEEKLLQITKNYSKCMFIGNCMGGSGALMMSHIATKVVVFNPHVDPSCHRVKSIKFANWLMPQSMRGELYRLIKENTTKTKGSVHVYGSKYEQIIEETSLLPSKVIVTLFDTTENISHYLKKNGKLIPLLRKEFQEMIDQVETNE